MLKENRLVGVEIEYTGKGNQNYWETKIRKIGEKFKINIETDYGRQHSMSDKVDFHLTYDGSVSGCGMELQSRPFYIQDKKFIDMIKKTGELHPDRVKQMYSEFNKKWTYK